MMALRDLLAAIETDAAAEAARLRAGRQAAAEAILARARDEASELQAGAVSAAEQAELAAAELRLAEARDAASTRLRQAHETAYQRIASDVRDQLREIRRRADYPQILASWMSEARAALSGATVVEVDPADEALARRLLAGQPPVTVEPALSCAGGAKVSDGAGATAVNTVEGRLAVAEPALRALTGQLLRYDSQGCPATMASPGVHA
jgi:vacuolar-type H+-ATPase subunit E/Vma4